MAFHGFNGARLILYECFGNRNDDVMIRWVFALSFIYVVVLGMLMLMGNQMVSPFLYWVIMFTQALVVAYGVATRILKKQTFCFMENAENQRVLSSDHGTCLLSIHPA